MATIAEELADLSGRVQTAFEHIEAKGGSVPAPSQQSTYELSTAIDSIPTGDGANFYGISSVAQAFPLSIDVETGKWVSLPKDVSPAATFRCPVKKVMNPYSSVADLTADNTQPRGFRNMFGKGLSPTGTAAYYIGASYPAATGSVIRQMFSWTPNVSAVEFPELTQVSSYMAFEGFCAGNTNIKRISFPKLSATAGPYCWDGAFQYNTSLEAEGVEQFWNGLSSVAASAGQFRGVFFVANCDRNWHLQFNPVMNYYGDYGFCVACAWSNVSSATICISACGNETTTGTRTFDGMFNNSQALKEISFPNLKWIRSNVGTTNGVFSQVCDMNDVANSQLTSVSFPELEVISGNGTSGAGLGVFRYAFRNCHKLQSIEFPKLRTVPTDYYCFNDAFNYCSSLTSISFPELSSAYQRQNNVGFFNYWSPTSARRPNYKLYLPKMRSLTFGTSNTTYNGFTYNCGLTDIYLNSVSSITGNYGFSTSNPQLTGLHFAAVYEEQIRATTGFATAWGRGAGNVTITFELEVPE